MTARQFNLTQLSLPFSHLDYDDAIECYSQAIYKSLPSMTYDRAIFHSNRAACCMKLARYEQALKDCNTGSL